MKYERRITVPANSNGSNLWDSFKATYPGMELLHTDYGGESGVANVYLVAMPEEIPLTEGMRTSWEKQGLHIENVGVHIPTWAYVAALAVGVFVVVKMS